MPFIYIMNEDFNIDDIIPPGSLKKPLPAWKKYVIIGAISAVVVIFLIVLIIIISTSSPKEDNKGKSDIPKDKIGEINCNYEISRKDVEIQIVGEEFKYEGNLDIVIDSVNIGFKKVYKFDKDGTHKITFLIYDSLNMDYMFKDVTSLSSIILFSNKKAKIKSMVSTFENCQRLNDFTLTGFDTGDVKSMKKFFYNSGVSLATLTGIETRNVEDFSYMFSYIPSSFIDLSKLDTKQAKNMSHMFEGCASVTTLETDLLDTSNVVDMSYMFSGCESLTYLNFEKLNTKNVQNMAGMFKDCISLIDIDLSNFDTSKVTDLSHMFDNCNHVRQLDLSKFNTENVRNMSNLFYFCVNLESLKISNFNTKEVRDMSNMFSYCRYITKFDIDNFDYHSYPSYLILKHISFLYIFHWL